MNDFKLESKQDIEDFLAGCAFFGTGGGGDVKSGRDALDNCLKQGLPIVLADPAGIRDDDFYCCAFFMGSIAPKTPETLEEMERNGYGERRFSGEDMLIGAVRKLEGYLGKKAAGLLIAEPGGANAACPMAAAYKMGLPVLDGDLAGRAIPEMTQGLCAILGIDCLPAVYFDSWGNSSITTNSFGYTATERIGKFMSQASYGEMAEAAYPLTGAQVKQVLVPGTLSRALKVGRAINGVSAKGEESLAVVADSAAGHLMGKGILHSVSTRDSGGYFWGTYHVKGDGAFAGNEYKIWFKNENHVLWVNGEPRVTSPDLISLVNYETRVPILNSHLQEGEPVGIIVSPSDDRYKMPEGIAVLGPRAFGFDFDYLPYNSAVRQGPFSGR